MQQVYHSNATTNLNIRTQIQNNSGTNSELALKFCISEQTVSKWRNRDFIHDASCKLNVVLNKKNASNFNFKRLLSFLYLKKS
jgi:nuclear transport factor 2 (NTF2) superfamily protein